MLKNFVKERQLVGMVKSNPISDEMEEIKNIRGIVSTAVSKEGRRQ